MLLPKLGGSGFYRRGTSLIYMRVTLWITTAIHLDTPKSRLDPFSDPFIKIPDFLMLIISVSNLLLSKEQMQLLY